MIRRVWESARLAQTQLKNVGWSLAALVGRAGLQAAVFVIIARLLGATDFGVFALMLAVAGLIAPLVDFGTYATTSRDVARGLPIEESIGSSLAITIIAAPVLTLFVAAGYGLLFGMSAALHSAVVCMGVLLGGKLCLVARSVFVVKEVFWKFAVVETIASVLQAAGVVVLLLLGGGLKSWLAIFALSHVVAGVVGLTWALAGMERIRVMRSGWRERLVEGFYLGIANVAQAGHASVDRIVLPMVAGVTELGIYSAATRVAALVTLPAMAVQSAFYPHVFRSALGNDQGVGLVAKIVSSVLTYGIVVVVVLVAGIDALLVLLGETYAGIGVVVALSASAAVFGAVAVILLDWLAALRRTIERSVVQVTGLILGVGVTFLLGREMGARGAAVAALTASFVMCLLAGGVAHAHRRRPKWIRSLPTPESESQ